MAELTDEYGSPRHQASTDARLKGATYRAAPDELVGIDGGLKAAREGRFATAAEVEAVFAKHRRT
jgi:hypothetical protein